MLQNAVKSRLLLSDFKCPKCHIQIDFTILDAVNADLAGEISVRTAELASQSMLMPK